MPDLTRFLHPTADGGEPDGVAVAALYEEIRRLARTFMRGERRNHTLPPTAVANEAYLRLLGGGPVAFATSAEFVAAAVNTLRRVLVDHGRRRARQKRGGGRAPVSMQPDDLAAPIADERLLALDEALARLAAFDPAKAKLVELRFFGGLSVDEAAKVLAQSPRTTARDWRVARAFLRAQLQAGDPVGSPDVLDD
jgi:RNA polymerase sigma-70 factor, ECF subfamily